MTRRQYTVIYADPPWRYRSLNRGHGGASDHYNTLDTEDIKRIGVPAASDSVAFLWSTMPMLPAALEVLGAWGFAFRSAAFVWIKLNPSGCGLATGLGHWTRSNAEVCLLGVRGRPRPVSHRVHSVVISPRGRHSEKPVEVRHRIVELMGDVPRLEMFARSHAFGWDIWGNEVGDSIKLEQHTRAQITRLPLRERKPLCGDAQKIRCGS